MNLKTNRKKIIKINRTRIMKKEIYNHKFFNKKQPMAANKANKRTNIEKINNNPFLKSIISTNILRIKIIKLIQHLIKHLQDWIIKTKKEYIQAQ